VRKFLLAAIALAAPVSAGAVESGLQVAVRAGFSRPFGKMDDSVSSGLSDAFTGFVPLGVELGWRATPDLFVGLTGTYAFGLTKNCPANASSCSGRDAAIGIEIRYYALPEERIAPWFGIGFGYEWLSTSQTTTATTLVADAEGVEFVHGELGADFATPSSIQVGPYIRFALGQYRWAKSSGPAGITVPKEIPSKALHEFLTFGVRVSFVL
jgi:outer membrane protein W